MAAFTAKQGAVNKKEYSLIGKIGSFKLQILSSSLSALDLQYIGKPGSLT